MPDFNTIGRRDDALPPRRPPPQTDSMGAIFLTSDELYQAVIVGATRRISCVFNRSVRQHYNDADGNEWASEINACCAEMALAKRYGLYWTGGVFDGKVSKTDVGRIQVRHSAWSNAHLIIYKEDRSDDEIVLVTGKDRSFFPRGWIVVRDGRNPEWWREQSKKVRCPSWWVPQSSLRPMRELEEKWRYQTR